MTKTLITIIFMSAKKKLFQLDAEEYKSLMALIYIKFNILFISAIDNQSIDIRSIN